MRPKWTNQIPGQALNILLWVGLSFRVNCGMGCWVCWPALFREYATAPWLNIGHVHGQLISTFSTIHKNMIGHSSKWIATHGFEGSDSGFSLQLFCMAHVYSTKLSTYRESGHGLIPARRSHMFYDLLRRKTKVRTRHEFFAQHWAQTWLCPSNWR